MDNLTSTLWTAFLQDDIIRFTQLLNQSGSDKLSNPTFSSPDCSTLHQQSLIHTINRPDSFGRTLLHLLASSQRSSVRQFVNVLLCIDVVDVYARDYENGWTALHRAFYFGNIYVAWAILHFDTTHNSVISTRRPEKPGLFRRDYLAKIRDFDGLVPFDLYHWTISRYISLHIPNETLKHRPTIQLKKIDKPNKINNFASYPDIIPRDELYTFGSNRNYNLGFGDTDDRQHLERVKLQRPLSLIKMLNEGCITSSKAECKSMSSGCTNRSRSQTCDKSNGQVNRFPLTLFTQQISVCDVRISKFHTAVLTTDNHANLYVCGYGTYGILGLGDEFTRFHLECVETGGLASRKIVCVALGLYHSLAVSSDGCVFSWGSNEYGQLGYQIPLPIPCKTSGTERLSDQVKHNYIPYQTTPRRILDILKREIVIGVAASQLHSVVYTALAMYTFGKNVGQLGIVNTNGENSDVQNLPRQVAASQFNSEILQVDASNTATVCLLKSHDVWVFANYGCYRIPFGLSSYKLRGVIFSPDIKMANHIVKVVVRNNKIGALSSTGRVFVTEINNSDIKLHRKQRIRYKSLINPSEIQKASSNVRCVWNSILLDFAAIDVAFDDRDCVLVVTRRGELWRGNCEKSVQFDRLACLFGTFGIRANGYGSYAVLRHTMSDIFHGLYVGSSFIRDNFESLLPIQMNMDGNNSLLSGDVDWNKCTNLCTFITETGKFSDKMARMFVQMGSTSSLRIPVHTFIMVGRVNVVRDLLKQFVESSPQPNSHVSVGDGKTPASRIASLAYEEQDLVVTLLPDEKTNPYLLLMFVVYLYTNCVQKVSGSLEQKLDSLLQLFGLKREAYSDCSRWDYELHLPWTVTDLPGVNAIILVEDGEKYFWVFFDLLAARSEVFKRLLYGKSNWLENRWEDWCSRRVVKLHYECYSWLAFSYVVRFVYNCSETELFEEYMGSGGDEEELEEFILLIAEVLEIGHELMIDGLVRACEKIMGKFIQLHNIWKILRLTWNFLDANSELRKAILVYININLESLMGNKGIEMIDENLGVGLDGMARLMQGYQQYDGAKWELRDPDLFSRPIVGDVGGAEGSIRIRGKKKRGRADNGRSQVLCIRDLKENKEGKNNVHSLREENEEEDIAENLWERVERKTTVRKQDQRNVESTGILVPTTKDVGKQRMVSVQEERYSYNLREIARWVPERSSKQREMARASATIEPCYNEYGESCTWNTSVKERYRQESGESSSIGGENSTKRDREVGSFEGIIAEQLAAKAEAIEGELRMKVRMRATLKEIQEEQEFEEWWNRETKRIAAEAANTRNGDGELQRNRHQHRGRGRGRGRERGRGRRLNERVS